MCKSGGRGIIEDYIEPHRRNSEAEAYCFECALRLKNETVERGGSWLFGIHYCGRCGKEIDCNDEPYFIFPPGVKERNVEYWQITEEEISGKYT